MKICKLISTSLFLMTTFSSHALNLEADYPIGVKVNSDGVQVGTKSLVDASIGIGGTSIRYVTYAASGMYNRNNGDINYSGAGCMDFDSGDWLETSIEFPNGSRIISITLKGNDISDTGYVSMEVLGLKGDGDFNDIVTSSINSGFAETPGYFSLTEYLDYSVQATESVSARITASSGSGNEACAVKVGYIPPSVASDVIFVDNFHN